MKESKSIEEQDRETKALLKSRRSKAKYPGGHLTLNQRKIAEHESNSIKDKLLRRFVTSQSSQLITDIRKTDEGHVCQVEEYYAVTNTIEFRFLWLSFIVRYEFDTEKEVRELKSKAKIQRSRKYHIKNREVTKEEYEAHKSASPQS